MGGKNRTNRLHICVFDNTDIRCHHMYISITADDNNKYTISIMVSGEILYEISGVY